LAELFIGFCNVLTPGLQLGLYDFDSTRFRWLDFSDLGKRIIGIKDIIHDEDGYCLLTLLKDNSTGITKLDRNLKLQKYYKFSKTFDAHSFILFEDGFLVTNTEDNSINEVRIINNTLKEAQYWKYPDRQNDVHINSITSVKDEIFVSMFGPKSRDSWDLAREGKILNISENEEICKDLTHPHSLTNVDGTIYWLESATGLVYRYSEKQGYDTLTKLDGYLRGMTYDEKNFYIASSAIRRNSRCMGVADVPASNKENMHSWIYRIDRKSLENEKRNLTVFGPEIRTLALTKYQEYQMKETTEDPILQRICAYENEYLKLQELTNQISQEREHLEQRVKAILNSKSWRITSPLRWLE
jgi:hypothetical protein